MARVALIGIAGAAGALTRYWISQAVGGRSFPWSTLGVNLAGSFLLGIVLAGPIAERWPPNATLAVSVGFLGAFTTLSTFTFETTALLRDDRPLAALVYVAASVVLGLAASVLGYVVGRSLA